MYLRKQQKSIKKESSKRNIVEETDAITSAHVNQLREVAELRRNGASKLIDVKLTEKATMSE